MPEISPDFPREWVEFADPADPDGDRFRCDITWLTSSWSCIYGNGCQGIYEKAPHDGCCSEGAMYSDKNDEIRVLKYAAKLKKNQWQFYEQARPRRSGGKLRISEVDEDNERKTRNINDGCIFLNRKGHQAPGFSGEMGCALHHLAIRENIHFVETKPDVCWQLPIRRSFEKLDLGDDNILNVTVIGEYERRGWGPGGDEFDWYCSSNSEAHNGKEPVYLSNSYELIKLMGDKAYAILKDICDAKMEIRRQSSPKLLPLLMVHPATLAAQEGKSR